MIDQDSIFLVSYSRLTWRVTLDGVLFGKYRSKQNAIKSVNDARQTSDRRLRSARLVMGAVERDQS